MNFVRFESKRIKLAFGDLIDELDGRPDDAKIRRPSRHPVVIDLSAPLPPSPRLAKSNAARRSELARAPDGDAA